MSQQPQGPGWWRAADGRWYPPQPQQPVPPPYQPNQAYAQPPPAPQSRNRGCVIAAVVVVVVVLAGVGVAGYFIYRAVSAVSEIAGGVGTFGDAKCPTEQDVSSIVGSSVKLVLSGNIVVAAGCSYMADDTSTGADVRITTGAALIADEQFASFASDAATQDTTPESIPVGDRAEAFGGSGRSGAIAVAGNALILVEVFNAGSTDIGDKKDAAITLLQQVVALR